MRFFGVWSRLAIYDGSVFFSKIGAEGYANLVFLLLGGLCLWRRGLGLPLAGVPILLLLAYYTAGHMAVNAKLRYAGPMMPLVYAFASDQILYWWRRWSGRAYDEALA